MTENNKSGEIKQEVPKVGDMVEFRNYLLQRFNDYEVPITMTAEQVRELIGEFYEYKADVDNT